MIDEQVKVKVLKRKEKKDTQQPYKLSYFVNLRHAYAINFTKQRQCENMKEQGIAQPTEHFSFRVQ